MFKRQSPRLAAKRKSKMQPPVRRPLVPKRLASGSKASRSSLSKRKQTVFKKAHELWQITGAEVLVVVKVKRRNGHSKMYYGGSKNLVEDFETAGISRGSTSAELYKKFDNDSDDEEDLLLGPLSPSVPNYMKSSLPRALHSHSTSPIIDVPASANWDNLTSTPKASIASSSRQDIPCPAVGQGATRHTATQEAPRQGKKPPTQRPDMTKAASTSLRALHSHSTSPIIDVLASANSNSNPTSTPKASTASSSRQDIPCPAVGQGATHHTATQEAPRQGKKPPTQRPDMTKAVAPDLTTGKWVAVAYHKTFYIGQINDNSLSGNTPMYKIKFAKQQGDKFVWPVRDEIEHVAGIYIFYAKDVTMVMDKGRVLRYTCSNLSDIRREYLNFKKLHSDIL
jgi:hypothetical protein